MPSDRHHPRAYALLGLVMLLWAGNSIVGRAVRADIPPFTLAFVRWSCASLVLLPFAAKSVWRDRAALLASWKAVLVLGVLGVGTFNALLYESLRHTGAANALLLQASIPPMVMALDFLFFRVRAKVVQGLGVALSILGVAAVVFQGDPAAALRLHFGLGDALVLIACLVWALYTVLLRLAAENRARKFRRGDLLDPGVGLHRADGGVGMARRRQRALEPRGRRRVRLCLAVPLADLLLHLPIGRPTRSARRASGRAITLMPLFGALLSAAILGEKLYAYHWLGMALILAGILLSAFALGRKVPSGAPIPGELEGQP